MAHAELAMRLTAPADRVWDVLTGPEIVRIILDEYAADVQVAGDGPPGAGSVLVTTLREGGVVRERVEAVDHEERSMRYRVLDAGPLPYANYRGEARVQPCGDDACVVSFACSFIPVDSTEADATRHWLDHNRQVLAALSRFVASA